MPLGYDHLMGKLQPAHEGSQSQSPSKDVIHPEDLARDKARRDDQRATNWSDLEV